MDYGRQEEYRVTGRIFVDPKQGSDLYSFLEGFLKQQAQHHRIERHPNRSLHVFAFDLVLTGQFVNTLVRTAESALTGYSRPSDFTVTSLETFKPMRHVFTQPRLKRAIMENDVLDTLHELGEASPLTSDFQAGIVTAIKRTTGLEKLETMIQVMK